MTSEELNVSTGDKPVKETTIIDPEDADLIDVDNDFDDWIEDGDTNEVRDDILENICQIW